MTLAEAERRIRAIAISGRCYVGTTTFSQRLAAALKWPVISGGQRFREYAQLASVSLDTIPLDIHRSFDQRIQSEIAAAAQVIFDGRYVGYFAREHTHMLRIIVLANDMTRALRCQKRDRPDFSVEQCAEHVQARDAAEARDASALFDDAEPLDVKWFDLRVQNESPEDMDRAVAHVLAILKGT